MTENKLIYVNGLGSNYKGDFVYEFIFSNTLEVWGDNWDSEPASGRPAPPDLEYITKVGVIRKTNIRFDLVQNSDYFSLIDASDNVIALAWEVESDNNKKRLVFNFGDSEDIVNDKLYERDLVLEYEKQFMKID